MLFRSCRFARECYRLAEYVCIFKSWLWREGYRSSLLWRHDCPPRFSALCCRCPLCCFPSPPPKRCRPPLKCVRFPRARLFQPVCLSCAEYCWQGKRIKANRAKRDLRQNAENFDNTLDFETAWWYNNKKAFEKLNKFQTQSVEKSYLPRNVGA